MVRVLESAGLIALEEWAGLYPFSSACQSQALGISLSPGN